MQFYSGPLMHFLSGVDTAKAIVAKNIKRNGECGSEFCHG
jgi:hypothetical protein